MPGKSNRKFWQMPYSYLQCGVAVAAIVFAGSSIQMLAGPFDFGMLAFPVNLVALALLLALCLLLGFYSESQRVRWISDVPLSVLLVVALVLFALLMGVVPQMGEPRTVFGLDAVTHHWAFVMVYGAVLISLGTLISRRLLRFRCCDWAFYANHVGIWLFFVAAGLGASDESHYEMLVHEGETVWHAEDERGCLRKLPLAIHLNDFDVDMYPTKQMMVDRRTGDVQSISEPTSDTVCYALSSLPAEPRAFLSDVELYTEDGDTLKSILEVNRPLRAGAWTIYQYGYDVCAGRASSYSAFLLVYDPWSVGVYVGIILMAVGSVSMLWKGRNGKKGGEHDVE